MTLYTKSGDGGDTDRGDGQRVRKSDRRIVALGELDELNAHIGLCLAACSAAGHGQAGEMLHPVQGDLCEIAAILGPGPAGGAALDSPVARMERQIDAACKELPPLEHLILPEGCELACCLHVARTVCRRAERAVVALADAAGPVPPAVLRYLNRLGDLLFVLARLANRHTGVDEQTWVRPK
ncbi:MAG: cob(I)yrinic acid a,c-diamide adenosyltransferase [Phycisphaerae bacterium]|nr:cob(I)yrinic acid a,c-diamide adenosyltransferase [Phycisphaerae bacterium]